MEKIKYIMAVIALLLSGCKEKSEILSGDITGKIIVQQQDQSMASDNSGVEAILYDYNDNLLASSVTESSGRYIFTDIPYGRYTIELQKQNYLQSNENPAVISHIGGYSPTLKDLNIYEVPRYEITVDSVHTDSLNYNINLYLKVDGNVEIPFLYNVLVAYYGSDPNVSSENYSGIATGVTGNLWSIYNETYNAKLYDFFTDLTGPIYMRLYLLTMGQSVYVRPLNPAGLGKPSNVVSFVWQN
jgi:hypothetical protein